MGAFSLSIHHPSIVFGLWAWINFYWAGKKNFLSLFSNPHIDYNSSLSFLKKKAYSFLETLNIELPYDPAFPFLGVYPKEIKSGSQRDICTFMIIDILFTIAKIWKQPECPWTDEWLKTMRVYTHKGILFSHKK